MWTNHSRTLLEIDCTVPVVTSEYWLIGIYKELLIGNSLSGLSWCVGLSATVLTFQLHVKDLNETIHYMYEHKMYQKVTSAPGWPWGRVWGGQQKQSRQGCDWPPHLVARFSGKCFFWSTLINYLCF
jgi:hypothetical protein